MFVSDNISISVKNDDDRRYLFDQYKILIESVNKANDIREISNNFWIGVNGFGMSIVAYFRNASQISFSHKTFFLATMITVGIIFCLIWLSYMSTIKKSVEASNKILMEVEKYFPVSIFANLSMRTNEKPGRPTLTLKEMLVPYLFIGGYVFFAILLVVCPQELIS